MKEKTDNNTGFNKIILKILKNRRNRTEQGNLKRLRIQRIQKVNKTRFLSYIFETRIKNMTEKRGKEEKNSFQGPDNRTHLYRMTEKLFSVGDDYWIENEKGKKAFYVDGKALRLQDTLILKDRDGNEVYEIKERLFKLRDTMDIKRDGNTVATVKKAFMTFIREKWEVELADGPDMEIQGDIFDYDYSIEANGQRVARISKSFFSLSDSYGIEIAPGQDDALILAIAAAIDQMAHDR